MTKTLMTIWHLFWRVSITSTLSSLKSCRPTWNNRKETSSENKLTTKKSLTTLPKARFNHQKTTWRFTTKMTCNRQTIMWSVLMITIRMRAFIISIILLSSSCLPTLERSKSESKVVYHNNKYRCRNFTINIARLTCSWIGRAAVVKESILPI